MPNSKKSEKIKLCLFNSTKAWGGGEKWHHDAAVYLSEKGYEITLAAEPEGALYHSLEDAEKNGMLKRFPVHIGNLSFLFPKTKRSLKLFFKKNKFDIIVMNLSADIKAAARPAHKAEVEAVVYRRGSAIPVRNTFLNRKLFGKYLTHILVNSEATKKTILQNNPSLFPENKIKLIYNGIDFSDFLKPVETKYFKRDNDEIIIGNLGRLEKQKAQYLLIDLAVILKQNKKNFKIVIGGTGSLEKKLKNYAHQKQVEDKICFCGFISDVPAFMQHIDIFALTSLWEGFGYVLAEAGICAKPVVAFKLSSNPELIKHNYNGKLVKYPDMQAFANAITELSDKETARQFAQNAYDYVRSKFDKTESLKRTDEYFVKILS